MKKLLIFLLIIFYCSIVYCEHEGEFGYCVLCDTKIFEKTNDNKIIRNSEYRENSFLLSNNSKMTIAFCSKHFNKLSEKDYPAIMGYIERAWEKEFPKNNWSLEQIDNYKNNFFGLKIIRRLDE